MALNAGQTTQMTTLEGQLKELKDELLNSNLCTMGGMGNYIFDQFKKIETQVKKVKEA